MELASRIVSVLLGLVVAVFMLWPVTIPVGFAQAWWGSKQMTTQAGRGGFFDDGGFPVGQGWDQIRFPRVDDENAYALEVTGDSMQPLYRDGDILIVSPNSAARKGDRVALRTTEGEVMAKILVRRTAKTIELASFNPAHPNLVFPVDRVDWMARIVWASQ